LKQKRTSSEHGRILNRRFDEEFLERVRAYRQTGLYRKALRKCKVWVKLMFAEAKEWHGMRRFRLRTLRRVNVETTMIAAGPGQNRKLLLTFGGRGPSTWRKRRRYGLPHRPPWRTAASQEPLVGDPSGSSRVFQHADAFYALS
jgi:hypothetical protein